MPGTTRTYSRVNVLRQLKEHIYSTTPEGSLLVGKRSLGHVSNYYTGEVISDEEVIAVQGAAEKHDVNVLNTRCVARFKIVLVPKPHKGPQKILNRVYPSGRLFGRSAIR